MAALINALDNYTPAQMGENGHVEYGWSNNIQETILQFSFQLTRTDEKGMKSLSKILEKLLSSIKHTLEKGAIHDKILAKNYLSILYRMIGHTRDIVNGKGEYTLTYMMIQTWHKFYPELAFFVLKCLVDIGKGVHQYGSWKDIKHFCEYCRNNGEQLDSPLILYAVKLINEQLRLDYANMISNSNEISLAAKWAPREKSAFRWLFHILSTHYNAHFLETAHSDSQKSRAILKCKTEYRKLISTLNKKIDTLQIKQCAQTWADINFDKVTSISLAKQKKAFLNITKKGAVRFANDYDRIECAENFKEHIENPTKEMKGKRVGMADFTKQALELLSSPNKNKTEIDLLNSQWCNNSSQNGALGKMIAMVDVSGSMNGDPMNVAIALGIRIAEKSLLGKRVMTFSSSPTWVNLEPYPDFVSQVKVLTKANWGMMTNFYAALDLILNAIIESKMEPEEVQDMVLVILSDMQMDAGDKCDKKVLYDVMKEKYEAAGIRVHGKPYKPPHILFWNLRSTSGFPSLANQPNCSMMSGFSPVILNSFCDAGLTALESTTPWSMLEKSLNNERYQILTDKIETEI